jgi:hypothetical protein
MSAAIASLMAVELPDDQRVALAHPMRGADVGRRCCRLQIASMTGHLSLREVSRGGTPPVPWHPTRYVLLYMYNINNIYSIYWY